MNIPTDIAAKLLSAGYEQGRQAANDSCAVLWAANATAISILIGELHRTGLVDAESIADQLAIEAARPDAAGVTRRALETLETQILGFAAQPTRVGLSG